MKTSCFVIALLLALATVSRASLAAHGSSSSILTIVGRELLGIFAKASGMLGSSARLNLKEVEGWRAAAADETKVKSLQDHKKVAVNCVPAKLCRRKRVICAKKCYKSRSRLDHFPTKCVVRCKKCVPTC